ncbi:MAG: flippase [bacterium]|nr:flippase [bacterium]
MLSAQKITANTSFFMLSLVLQKVLSFVYFTFLARNLGVSATGQYFFAISFATMFSVLVDFGLSPLIIREVAKKTGDIQDWFQQIFTLKIIFAAITALIILALNFILFYDDPVKKLIYISTTIVIIDSFTLLFYAVIRGRQSLKWESFGTIIFQLIIIALGLSLMQVTDNVALFILVLLCASLFNLIFSAYILIYKFKVKIKFSFSISLTKEILKFAWPFALAAIFAKVYAYMDTFLLKVFLGDQGVGFYSIAYKITFALQFIPLAFVAALYPAFSNYFKEDYEKLKKVFSQSFNYLAFISLPIAFGAIALAGDIVSKLYTSEFSYSILPLQILIASVPFLFVNFSLSSFLNASGREKTNTRNLGLVMTFNVLFNLFFIPRFGIWGASLVSSISTLLLFALNFYYVTRIIKPELRSFLPILGSLMSSTLMFLAVLYLKTEINWILSIMAGAVIYLILMLISRSLKWHDIISIKNLVFKSS